MKCIAAPLVASLTLLMTAATPAQENLASPPPIARVLPPPGIEAPPETREQLTRQLAATQKRLLRIADHRLAPDVEIFVKAVDFALRFEEFYSPKDFNKAFAALKTANERLDSLEMGKSPWTKQTGLVARGYRSAIDGSAQPYGVVIPKNHDFTRPTPAYVWLHGRGDKNTDLHFLHERQTSPGQITPPNAIVLHPFGRHCVGFKSAGEIDVLDVMAHAGEAYNTDADRIVLIGFSMGGAGAWHIGAHYTDHFCAVAPGAGFAETARYVKLKPENYPADYVQTLWGVYDVPNYVRNLFNVPTMAYSGENDKQIQAARVMEAAFEAEGAQLTHLIGPGVEHKYEPKTLAELLKRLEKIVAKGRDKHPATVHLQTRTLRYNKYAWVEITSLDQQWADSRVDAELAGEGLYKITTKNVTGLRLAIPREKPVSLEIDGKLLRLPPPVASAVLQGARLRRGESGEWAEALQDSGKRHGLQGPIDDAFLQPFIIVTPSGTSEYAQAWVDFELQHFSERWRTLMRGEPRIVADRDLTPAQIEKYNLIVWGDADSNQLFSKLATRLPVRWHGAKWSLSEKHYDRQTHVPALICPNPLNPQRYLVLNSGLTFREAHDRTNSQQNPKLPDWAVIDITQPPDANAPGKIVEAGFFP